MLVKRKETICAHRKRERTTNEAFALRRGKKLDNMGLAISSWEYGYKCLKCSEGTFILGKKSYFLEASLWKLKEKSIRKGQGMDKSFRVWQEHRLWQQFIPCSDSAAAAEWAHLLRWASASPAPHPSCRSTSTAPPKGPAVETSAQHSPPDVLCQDEAST